MFDDKCCHELNCFIRYQDPEFFEKVVKPFLSNKLQKTFVDFCLLNLPEAEKYTDPENMNNLNAFEKCLLIDYLVRN